MGMGSTLLEHQPQEAMLQYYSNLDDYYNQRIERKKCQSMTSVMDGSMLLQFLRDWKKQGI